MSRTQATTLEPGYSLSAMLSASGAVVVARVAAQQVVAAPSGSVTRQETHTELHVERYLRGDGPRVRILRQLGDATASGQERIASDAVLIPGRRVLLFLRTAPQPSAPVHLTLLGYAAYDLEGSGPRASALPQARLAPRAPGGTGDGAGALRSDPSASGPELGRPSTFAAIERFVRGAAP